MDTKETRSLLGKAEIAKLKALGAGLKVGRVLGERVLVKTITPFTKADDLEKKGLLYVPETVKEANTPRPNCGVVIARGPEVALLEDGEMVLFSKYGGTELTVDSEEGFRILDVSEILCTLEDTQGVVAPIVEEGDAS